MLFCTGLVIDRPGVQGDQFGPGYPQFSLHTAPEAITDSFIYNFTIALGGDAGRVPSIIKEIREFHAKVLAAWHHYVPPDNYHILRVKDLESVIENKLTWKTLINTIITPASLEDNDEIAVTCVACLEEIAYIISKDQAGSVQYLILSIMLDSVHSAFKGLRGQLVESSEDYCRCTMARWFYMAIDNAYVETRVSDISIGRDLITPLFESLKKSMLKLIKYNQNFQDESGKYARAKINQMKLYYGSPDFLSYFSAAANIINEAGLSEGFFVIPATQNIRQNFLRIMFLHLDQIVNPAETIRKYFSATSLDIHYDYQENAIVVPAAALHEYYLSRKLPDEVIHGLLGTILAHEMAHAFDPQGRQFNASGNMFDTHTLPANLIKFLDKASLCLVTQFSRYTNPLTKHKVDATKTLVENIADTGGTCISYESIFATAKPHFLPGFEKYPLLRAFWLSYASRFCSKHSRATASIREKNSIHAPNYYRVNGVVSNLFGFSDIFGCKTTDKMYPKKTCNIYYNNVAHD